MVRSPSLPTCFELFADFGVLEFMAKIPARKFRGYQCVGPAVFQVDEKNPRVSIEEVVWSNPKVAAETATYVE
jgi:SP family sugar:H+ symporter-like MFS transporter